MESWYGRGNGEFCCAPGQWNSRSVVAGFRDAAVHDKSASANLKSQPCPGSRVAQPDFGTKSGKGHEDDSITIKASRLKTCSWQARLGIYPPMASTRSPKCYTPTPHSTLMKHKLPHPHSSHLIAPRSSHVVVFILPPKCLARTYTQSHHAMIVPRPFLHPHAKLPPSYIGFVSKTELNLSRRV